jgi:hypothetical protein
MSLRVFDTQLGAQGMEGVGKLRHCLSPLLTKHGPSHLLVVIVTNKLILFLEHIHKKISSGLDPVYSRLLRGTFVRVIFPLIFDMGDILKEHKGDRFHVEKIVDKETTF